MFYCSALLAFSSSPALQNVRLNQRLRLTHSSLEDLEEVVVMDVKEADMAVVLEATVEVMDGEVMAGEVMEEDFMDKLKPSIE